jgi:hypothetical protein
MTPRTQPASDSSADFFPQEPVASFDVGTGSDQGDIPMTFMAPFAKELSVVAAYVAIAFVGAIVLGVF